MSDLTALILYWQASSPSSSETGVYYYKLNLVVGDTWYKYWNHTTISKNLYFIESQSGINHFLVGGILSAILFSLKAVLYRIVVTESCLLNIMCIKSWIERSRCKKWENALEPHVRMDTKKQLFDEV